MSITIYTLKIENLPIEKNHCQIIIVDHIKTDAQNMIIHKTESFVKRET